MFMKDNTAEYIKEQVQKLLIVVIKQVKEVVNMLSRAMVLFYQLDVSANETTEVCLYNLLMSLVLKNPIYSRIVDLFRVSYRDELQRIEIEIERTSRWDYGRAFGVNEVEFGRKML